MPRAGAQAEDRRRSGDRSEAARHAAQPRRRGRHHREARCARRIPAPAARARRATARRAPERVLGAAIRQPRQSRRIPPARRAAARRNGPGVRPRRVRRLGRLVGRPRDASAAAQRAGARDGRRHVQQRAVRLAGRQAHAARARQQHHAEDSRPHAIRRNPLAREPAGEPCRDRAACAARAVLRPDERRRVSDREPSSGAATRAQDAVRRARYGLPLSGHDLRRALAEGERRDRRRAVHGPASRRTARSGRSGARVGLHRLGAQVARRATGARRAPRAARGARPAFARRPERAAGSTFIDVSRKT
ncbi:putative cysteine synthase [Burkholderia pseudomallei MSHR511]|nr:putative cysteine synthase [Burkholderia pseudomallei NAU20B-16]AHG33276.1 putative cysteine synthase [Burkholderia pseudomallei MSHR511]AHG66965.1 putative cysteine synthase [Burkholderia pseudomallei MSHR146]KGW31980.1 putative cysteine synthase [Burkholderia pseudomallei MSHR3016]